MSSPSTPDDAENADEAEAGAVDLEAALDRLIAAGAVDEADDGALTTTGAYEDVRGVYADTYGAADEGAFRSTVAEVFALDRETVDDRVAAGDVTRENLVAYLALQSFLDERPDPATLGAMADIVAQVEPGSPVPDGLLELDDDTYESFLAEHPDALLTVWKRHCAPCEAMKEELDDVLAALPEGVAAAGLDGEAVPAFRRAYEVDAAPTLLFVRDGDLRETLGGRQSPAQVAETATAVWGEDGPRTRIEGDT